MIWAVILAAGESRRMGGPKLSLPYGGRTVIEEVIKRVTASRVDGTLVVLGSHWRTLKERTRKYRVATAVNPRFRQGMLSSVQRGIRALPQKCLAAVVVLGDQPDINPKVINLLIDAYRRERKRIIIPVYGKKRGHPVLIDLAFRKEIAVLHPEIGLRELMLRHPEEIFEVRMPRSSSPPDLNTPEDYQKALRRKGKGKASNFS